MRETQSDKDGLSIGDWLPFFLRLRARWAHREATGSPTWVPAFIRVRASGNPGNSAQFLGDELLQLHDVGGELPDSLGSLLGGHCVVVHLQSE